MLFFNICIYKNNLGLISKFLLVVVFSEITTCSLLVNVVFGFGLAISLIVLAVLIYAIKESNNNGNLSHSFFILINLIDMFYVISIIFFLSFFLTSVSAAQQAKQALCKNWQANIYSAVIFTVMNDNKKKANMEKKKIYAAVME